jgi:hypothetical protein
MVVLTLRKVNIDSKVISTIDVPDDFTFSGLISLLSERDHLDPNPARLVHRGLILDPAASVTSIETSESAPINVFAKPAHRSSSPPPVSPSSVADETPASPPPESTPPPPQPADPRIQKFLDMGFGEEDSLRALELAHGSEEVAAELLCSGDVSAQGIINLARTVQAQMAGHAANPLSGFGGGYGANPGGFGGG